MSAARSIIPAVTAGALALILILWLTRASLSALGYSQFTGAILRLLHDSMLALPWCAAAWGFGLLVVSTLPRDRAKHIASFAFGAGVSLMLFLDHVLGQIGLLQAGDGSIAWGVIVIGMACGAVRLYRLSNSSVNGMGNKSHSPWLGRWLLLAAVPALAVLLVASTSAPGWLWDSEAGGYDVLEYHLEAPKEWYAQGFIAPQQHNVYSYFPGYVEAAFYHLGLLDAPLTGSGPVAVPGTNNTITRNPVVDAATACQLLNALLTVWSCLEVGLLCRSLLARTGVPERDARRMRLAFAGMTLAVPWMVVTGSMAYNDVAVVGLLAWCWRWMTVRLLPGEESELPRPLALAVDWIIFGFALGVSMAVKETAIGFVIAPLMIVSLWAEMLIRRRTQRSVFVAGLVMPTILIAIGGLAANAPWLIRNAIATAPVGSMNPFFPFATGIFGTAHWTTGQAARFHGAVEAHKTFLGRFAALWAQGFIYNQWAGLFFIAVASGAIAFWRCRRANTGYRAVVAATMAIGLTQLLFWLFFTHLQSRFLLPCVVPIMAIIALALTPTSVRPARRLVAIHLVPAAMTLLFAVWTMHNYLLQKNGLPATYVDGAYLSTGARADQFSPADLKALTTLNAEVFINCEIPSDLRIYLLGDATPFYILRSDILWHTTYDTSPLGQLIRTFPEDPAAWRASLYDQGVRIILVNFSELHRLIDIDHWYDPDVTDARVDAFLRQGVTPIMGFPPPPDKAVRVLYRLNPPMHAGGEQHPH